MKWLRLGLVFGILLFNAVPVFAAQVTVTYQPAVTTGILNFTIIYVSDNRIDITWNLSPILSNIMIRGKYGAYPADITSNITAPSDGYLVYYGSGNSTSDTGVSFEETAAPIYYRAWSQNAGGIWEESGISGFIEGGGMTLIAIILFGAIVSLFALWKKSLIIGFSASGVWLFLLMYTRANPINGVPIASATDEFLVLALLGVIVTIPFFSWKIGRNEKAEGGSKEERQVTSIRQNRLERHGWDKFADSSEEYQSRVHSILHPKRKRR